MSKIKTAGYIGKEHECNAYYEIDGISPTLRGNSGGQTKGQAIIERERESNIRRLTPIECERLQGFPDNWTQGISETQRYKTLGNAISVPIVEMIIERLFR